MNNPTDQTQVKHNRIFGVLLLVTETILIFMFGFFITYTPARAISDDHFIIAALLILALCGFGLLTTYVRPVSSASLTHVIIILGLCVQLYFPFRGFWQIIGLPGPKWDQRTNGYFILPVELSNSSIDRQVSQMLTSSAVTDCIACFISLIVAYSAIVGRVGNLQVYFFTVLGTFIYQFNSMIFWRIFVTDAGFGMRIFLFGGTFGLFSSLILGKKETTKDHPRFISDYYFQSMNLLGAIIIWCLLPVLCWSDLWHLNTYGTDSSIVNISSLNMWFALCGSAVGSFCGSVAAFKKLSVHTIIFSVFTGGIAFTSVSDIYFNPGVAIAIGVISSFICSLLVSKIKKSMNQHGVKDSNGVLGSYMIPGLIAGILSAIFQANGNNNMNGSYNINNKDPTLNQLQQGGIQLAGLGIAIGCGLFVGIVSGIIMKIFNREYISQQFDCSYVVRENRIEHVPEKY